ncbi:MAG: response regulator [Pseudomonadota bacterium]
MEQGYHHTVLIVDDENAVGRAIAGILKNMGVEFAYAPSGDIALEKIQGTSTRFSLIISDQKMPGLSGYELFEKAREISPDTVRFLITGHMDMAAIIKAVNRGAIHRCIAKPWDNDELALAIAQGLKQYELVLDNERLLNLAKDQNLKLYRLNRDLKEKAEEHRKVLDQLDQEIGDLNQRIAAFENDPSVLEKKSMDMLETLFRESGLLDEQKIHGFYAATLQELRDQFQDIAVRNGFEMPKKA